MNKFDCLGDCQSHQNKTFLTSANFTNHATYRILQKPDWYIPNLNRLTAKGLVRSGWTSPNTDTSSTSEELYVRNESQDNNPKSLGSENVFWREQKLYSARTHSIETFIMLQNTSISNKCCSFELSIHQRILNRNSSPKILSTTFKNVAWSSNYL